MTVMQASIKRHDVCINPNSGIRDCSVIYYILNIYPEGKQGGTGSLPWTNFVAWQYYGWPVWRARPFRNWRKFAATSTALQILSDLIGNVFYCKNSLTAFKLNTKYQQDFLLKCSKNFVYLNNWIPTILYV